MEHRKASSGAQTWRAAHLASPSYPSLPPRSKWGYSMNADSYCGPDFFKPNRLVLGTAWAMIIQRDGHLDKTRLRIQLQLGDALKLARLAQLVHGLRSKRCACGRLVHQQRPQ